VTKKRSSSLLTKKQRSYLQNGPDGSTDDAERMMRSRIRSRLRAGVEDFSIVFDHLDPDDRVQLTDFDSRSELVSDDVRKEELRDSRAFAEGLMSMIAFAIRCADDMGVEPEGLFQASLQRYAERIPEIDSVDVEVAISRQSVDLFGHFGDRLDRLQERFEDGEHLSTTEMQMLFDRDRIDREDVHAYFEDATDSETD